MPAIDMDSYRVEKKAVLKIALTDEDAEVEPAPTDARGRKAEPELDRLSNILKTFNEQFGTLFTDTDRVAKRIREDIAPNAMGVPSPRYFGQFNPTPFSFGSTGILMVISMMSQS